MADFPLRSRGVYHGEVHPSNKRNSTGIITRESPGVDTRAAAPYSRGMALAKVSLGAVTVSRLAIGGNPFSGFSHQGPARDREMRRWYTTARIKEALRRAEAAGITTLFARADNHVMRLLEEYWDEGGTIQWFAQTAPELGTLLRGVEMAVGGGAKAVYVHGGVMDRLLAVGKLDEVPPAIERIRRAGLAAGVAGHDPRVFEWAEKNLDCDFYMCSYYNPIARTQSGEHRPGQQDSFDPADREAMVRTIARLSKPAIHYKVMAAGRNDPREALQFVARHLRPEDAVCIGFFTQAAPNAIEEDLRLLEEALA